MTRTPATHAPERGASSLARRRCPFPRKRIAGAAVALLSASLLHAHAPPIRALEFRGRPAVLLARGVRETGGGAPGAAMGTAGPGPVFLPRRWRLLGLAAAAAALAAAALHRARVLRALALEQVRRQIATDLHDEIGSGLSQIAILSEVGKREAHGAAADLLDEVARLARSMREAMGDIVWTVDPQRDHLSDLVSRMRQVTYNLLESEGTKVRFEAPEDGEIGRVGLHPERRRQIFLIFKETIANVARHARASNVRVALAREGAGLRLEVHDDGRGFDPAQPGQGNGLPGLRRRAAALGAALAIESAPGRGTRVALIVPAGGRLRRGRT